MPKVEIIKLACHLPKWIHLPRKLNGSLRLLPQAKKQVARAGGDPGRVAAIQIGYEIGDGRPIDGRQQAGGRFQGKQRG